MLSQSHWDKASSTRKAYEGLCGDVQSWDQNYSKNRRKISNKQYSEEDNWQNKWRIAPKESLFVAWMSFNLNVQQEDTKDTENTMMHNTDVYYRLDYLNPPKQTCIPVSNNSINSSYLGNNLL